MLILSGVCLEALGQITIFCEYSDDSYHRLLYTCVATASPACQNCTNIGQVTGTHLYGKTNDDVKAFVMENKNVTEVPKNIASFFPHISYLNFKNNLITTLSGNDLTQLRKLDSVRFTNNAITGIYEDIFKDLLLVNIEFDNNNIEYVTHNLTYSGSLNYLNFKNNKCIDTVAKSAEGIEQLKDRLLFKCSHNPRIGQLEENVLTIEKHDLQSDVRISTLENVIKKFKKAMEIKLYK